MSKAFSLFFRISQLCFIILSVNLSFVLNSMIRSPIGISRLPVSAEIDPGFGPDTEQRRVEFAAKLEEEAFSISIGDATKLAKANLITALKLWKQDNLVKFVEKLELRDIMLIWLIFEIAYISKVWGGTLAFEERKHFCSSKETLREFLQAILASLAKDIPKTLVQIVLDIEAIKQLREEYGGDLVFALKRKNENEVIKLYQMVYSKLPKSLRDKYYEIITGVKIEYKNLVGILSKTKKGLLKKLVMLICEQMNDLEEYKQGKERIEIMNKIIEVFDAEVATFFEQQLKQPEGSPDEVKEKVKKYYGIE